MLSHQSRERHGDLHFDAGEVVITLEVLPHEEIEGGGGVGAHLQNPRGAVSQKSKAQVGALVSLFLWVGEAQKGFRALPV